MRIINIWEEKEPDKVCVICEKSGFMLQTKIEYEHGPLATYIADGELICTNCFGDVDYDKGPVEY